MNWISFFMCLLILIFSFPFLRRVLRTFPTASRWAQYCRERGFWKPVGGWPSSGGWSTSWRPPTVCGTAPTGNPPNSAGWISRGAGGKVENTFRWKRVSRVKHRCRMKLFQEISATSAPDSVSLQSTIVLLIQFINF